MATAATASYALPHSAGRSINSPSLYYNNSSNTGFVSSLGLAKAKSKAKHQATKPSLSLATRLNASESSLGHDTRAGAHSLSSRSHDSQITDNMTSYTSTATIPPAPRSTHAKLHKRASSGSSVAVALSPPLGPHAHFTTPFATYEEFSPVTTSSSPSVGSTAKIKPYLRKPSAVKEGDQGKLDLSKPVAENDMLAGLGIQDFAARTANDVTFAHAGKRGTHARTTSVGSQVSTGSGSFRPSQPFVHPMRQTPRPYTPPTGSSTTSFVNEDEAQESNDTVEDEFRPAQPFRSRRSISISSTAPTPLSQTHTADELGIVPKLTSPSQTNLSIKSVKSVKSTKSRLGRSRRNTEHSQEQLPSPSTRTSLDKTLSFVSRRSDPDAQTRDERIRAARRKFDEKEANKDRKMEKRRETVESKQQRKSEASVRTKLTRPRESPEKSSHKSENEKNATVLQSRSYEESRASSVLPQQGLEAGESEKPAKTKQKSSHHHRPPQTGWVRFSAWYQTRILSCAGGRK